MHETTGGRDFHRRGGSVEIYAFGEEKRTGQDRGYCGAKKTAGIAVRCTWGERERATRSAVLYGEGRHGRDARAWGFICHDAQGSHVRRHVTCFLSPLVLVRTQRPHGVVLC